MWEAFRYTRSRPRLYATETSSDAGVRYSRKGMSLDTFLYAHGATITIRAILVDTLRASSLPLYNRRRELLYLI
jgi:hypothetical protein